MKTKLIKSIKLTLSIITILTIAACSNVEAETIQPTKQIDPIQQYKVSNTYNPPIEKYINNVGNNESYTYKITSVSNNEVHGEATNNISLDNAGIFLYQSELDFNVQPGDTISVVWGQYEDEFKSIKIVN